MSGGEPTFAATSGAAGLNLSPTERATESLIVSTRPGRLREVRTALQRRGAKIGRTLTIIESLAVAVAPGHRSAIASLPGVLAVNVDAQLRPLGQPASGGTPGPLKSDDTNTSGPSNVENRDPGSTESIARVTGALALWKKGFTGRGVDVALIDTGIAPVPGSPESVNGADLSIDSGTANLRFVDGFGHGTHMAGIIAGHDPGLVEAHKANGAFVGIAPGSRIVNVKVGGTDGGVHVSQVVAALDWVVQNRQANGMNIRVVNLSYGAPATPDWRRDPLAWAAEVAWRRGVLVVSAAGNEGPGHQLASPAYSPQILAVGATEVENRRGGRREYLIAPYTSTGDRRRPDLYVPGSHVISLRVKGSFVDTFLARSNIDDQLTRGSGTSQATAVTSGLAALLFEAFPSATPDQIKWLLTATVDPDRSNRDVSGIETSVDLAEAWKVGRKSLAPIQPTDPFVGCEVTWCRGAGEGDPLLVAWARSAWNSTAWTGNQWTGNQWTGNQWTGNQWTGNQWTGNQWTGNQWTSTWAP